MKNAMALCADAINDAEQKIVEALKSTNDSVARSRLAEALSFISEAREAITAAKTKIDSIPPPNSTAYRLGS